MNAEGITPFIRYAHYIEPQYLRNLKTRLGYDHRIFFCESGSIEISTNDASYQLKKNSLLYVPSGVVYIFGEHDEGTKLIGINFDFTFAFSEATTPIAPAISKIIILYFIGTKRCLIMRLVSGNLLRAGIPI